MAWGEICVGISVSISPNPKVARVNQSFSVNVRLDTATQIRGLTIHLSHDTTKLNFGSASQGALFNGSNVGWWIVNTSDTPGTTRVECIIFGQGEYISGPGNLLNLNYTPTSGDYTTLTISAIELYHPQTGLAMPDISTENGSVIIGNQAAYAKIKCWLEGSYVGGYMKSDLGTLLPLSSPYPSAPGSVNSIPADIVDWMWVELRSTATGSPITTQAVFIRNDGAIISPGKAFLIFMNIPPGSYYVIVRHRNHLAVMSSGPVIFSGTGNPVLFDFSALNNVYGRTGVVEKEAGVYVMAAGDADQDGGIYPADRNNFWRAQSGTHGYLSGDFNLDGNVFPSDLNNYWRLNSGMGTNVPVGAR